MTTTTTTTRTFFVLSDVKDSTGVFDNLIQVVDIVTQEEFLLLCSHYCRWPANLLQEATLIEGCFTPYEYREDTRLALGYHPNSVTSWEIDYPTNTITLTTRVSSDSNDSRNTTSLRLDWLPIQLHGNFRPYELRYLRRFINMDIPSPAEGFATECMRLHETRPKMIVWLPYFVNWVWQLLTENAEYPVEIRTGSRLNLPEHGQQVEVSCTDDGRDDGGGYRGLRLVATDNSYERQPYDRNHGELIVNRDMPGYGWHKSVPMPYSYNGQSMKVDYQWAEIPLKEIWKAHGWIPAIGFPYELYSYDRVRVRTVTRNEKEDGWLVAEPLPYSITQFKDLLVTLDKVEYGWYKAIDFPYEQQRPDLLVVHTDIPEEGWLMSKTLSYAVQEYDYNDYDSCYDDSPYVINR